MKLRKNTSYTVHGEKREAESMAELIKRLDEQSTEESFEIPDAIIPRGVTVVEKTALADFEGVNVGLKEAEDRVKERFVGEDEPSFK